MTKFIELLNQKFYLILLFLILFIPIYPKFPFMNVPGTYVAIRLEDLVIALVIVLWIIAKSKNIKHYLKQNIFTAILLFWVIGGLSLLSALLITHSIMPHIGILHWFRRIEYMLLFFIAATALTSIEQLKMILKWCFVASLIIAFYGFGQVWFGFYVISTTNREFSKGLLLQLTPDARVNSTFAGHYDLAVYLSIILVFLAALFFYTNRYKEKFWIALAGGINFLLLGMTAARMSFVATFLGICLVLWMIGKRWLIIGVFITALIPVVLIPELRHRLVATFTVNILGGGGPKYVEEEGSVNLFTPDGKVVEASKSAVIDQVVNATYSATESAQKVATIAADIAPGEPINTTELGVYRSFGIRFNVEWPRALRAFYKNPLLGTGYSSISIATDNDYLRSLGEVGLLGTLSIILVFFILLKKAFMFIRQQTKGFEYFFMIGFICATVAFLITAIFIDVLEASKVAGIYWMIAGLAYAVMRKFKDA